MTCKWRKSNVVRRAFVLLLAIVAAIVGGDLARTTAQDPGYVASFGFAGTWIVAGAVAGLGMLLCIPRPTRFLGLSVAISGVVLLGSFYATILTLKQMGRVNWTSKMISLGPDVKANLLVYFKSGTSWDEIRDFEDRLFHLPEQPGRRGRPMRPELRRLLGLNPVQGHSGIAVDFAPSATPEQRREIISDVMSDSLVYRILTDTIPNEVANLD